MVELAVPVGESELMPDQFRKQNQHIIRIPLCHAPKQKSVRCNETGIEHQIRREATVGKQPQPANGGLHIDVRRIHPSRGSRGKQDGIRGASQILDYCLSVFGRYMLQDLKTGDQIEPPLNRTGERRLVAVWLHVYSDFPNGVFGNIDPVGLNTPLPQRFHKEALGASGIEGAPRLQRANNMVGNGVEDCYPMVVSIVWNAAAVVVVIVFVVPGRDGFWIW